MSFCVGFLRGEHYCIALCLLVNGHPQVSVLGCPNLSLAPVVSASDPLSLATAAAITHVPLPIVLSPPSSSEEEPREEPPEEYHVFPPSAGSMYFAVTNQGAFAKSLSMVC